MEPRGRSPSRALSFGAIARFEAGIRGDISNYWKMIQAQRASEESPSDKEWLEVVLLANKIIQSIEQLRFISERYIDEHPNDRAFLRFYSHVILLYTANARKSDSVFTLATTRDIDEAENNSSETSGFWNERATTKGIVPLVDHPTGNDISGISQRWIFRNSLLALLPAVIISFICSIVFLCLTTNGDIYEEQTLLAPSYGSTLTYLASTVRSAQLAASGIWDVTEHESGVSSPLFSQYIQEISIIEAHAESLGSDLLDESKFSKALTNAGNSTSGLFTRYMSRSNGAICPLYSRNENASYHYRKQLEYALSITDASPGELVCNDSSLCSIDLVSLLVNSGLSPWENEAYRTLEIPCFGGNSTETVVLGGKSLVEDVETRYKRLVMAEGISLGVFLLLLVVPLIPLLNHIISKVSNFRKLVRQSMNEMDSLLICASALTAGKTIQYGVAHVDEIDKDGEILNKELLTQEYKRLKLDASSDPVPVLSTGQLGLLNEIGTETNVESSTEIESDERASLVKPKTHIRKCTGDSLPLFPEISKSPTTKEEYEKDLKNSEKYKIIIIAVSALIGLIGFVILLLSLLETEDEKSIFPIAYKAASLSTMVIEINNLLREASLGMRLYPPHYPFPDSCRESTDEITESFTYSCADERGQITALYAWIGGEIEDLNNKFTDIHSKASGYKELETLYEDATCFRRGMALDTPPNECHGDSSYQEHSSLYPQPIWPRINGEPVAGLANIMNYYIGAATILVQCNSHIGINDKALSEKAAMFVDFIDLESEDVCEKLIDYCPKQCSHESSVEHNGMLFPGVCNPYFSFIWDIGGIDIVQGLERAAEMWVGPMGKDNSIVDDKRRDYLIYCGILIGLEVSFLTVFILAARRWSFRTGNIIQCDGSVVLLVPDSHITEVESGHPGPSRSSFKRLLDEGKALGLVWRHAATQVPCSYNNIQSAINGRIDERTRETPASIGALCEMIRKINETAGTNGDMTAAIHALSALASAPNNGINLNALTAASNAFSETPIPGMHIHDVAPENTASGSPCYIPMRRRSLALNIFPESPPPPQPLSTLAAEHQSTSSGVITSLGEHQMLE